MDKLKEGSGKPIIKRVLPHVAAIACLFLITVIYFSPLFEGKVLTPHDVTQYSGASHELSEYYKNEGKSSAWTGSMFSGMPSYQIAVMGGSPNFLDYLEKPVKAILSPTSSAPFFMAMLMAYVLFCIMGFSPIISLLGAISFGMASYNLIIIEAGHVTKMWTIAYMPLVMAGVVSLFKRKYLWGALLLALGIAFQIKSNHIQITFYTGLLCIFLYLGFIIKELKHKEFKELLKLGGFSLIAIILALSCNLGNFYANFEMSKVSTRGQTELTAPTESEKQSSGLDKDYAFAWSYGKAETLSLLIPNIHGGSSGSKFEENSELLRVARSQGLGLGASPSYWGDQPFTSGPVYFGAIIIFLFVLGMIIIKNKMKWVVLIATIFFIFLSWGRNFEWFNDFLFYHFPFYNKFRTVSMALVIPSLTMVVIAVWGVSTFFSGKIDKSKLMKALYWSAGTVGFICLFFWLMPGFFFDFTSVLDEKIAQQLTPQIGLDGWNNWFYPALLADRKDMLSSDALRSLIYILLAFGILWGCLKIKSGINMAFWGPAALAFLILIDLWGVDKRYLGEDSFKIKSVYFNQSFSKSVADQIILQDQSLSYRVLNLNNPFNESKTSYFHKSVGGYHAAKMRRYQELIDFRLQPEIMLIINSLQSQNIDTVLASFNYTPSLNMLNTRYIILHPDNPPLFNEKAFGNAWFVKDYKFVDTPDEELNALNIIDPRTMLVANKKDEELLKGLNIVPDSTSQIELITYKPDLLVYKSKAATEQLAVFSEIYYDNGWEAYIDGEQVPYFSANWILRALRVPAGEHEIEFRFIPKKYHMVRIISTVSSAILLLMFLGVLILKIREIKTEK